MNITDNRKKFFNRLLTSRTVSLWVFWLCILIPLCVAIVKNIAHNGFSLYEHIAQPHQMFILACILVGFSLSCWCWTWMARKLFMPKAHKLWAMYFLAVLGSMGSCVMIYLPEGCCIAVFLSMMGTMCISWAVLKRLSLLFWFPFLFIEMVQLGAYAQYGTLINNPIVLAEIFEASSDEVLGYVNIFNISLALVVLILCYTFCYLLGKTFQDISRLSLLNVGTISLLLVSGFLHLFHPSKFSIDNLWPSFELAKFHFNIGQATAANDKLVEFVKELPSPALKPSSMSTLQDNAGVVMILHIGESVRADRLGINGYRNNNVDTTPWLSSQLGKNTLINFRDCISSAPMTCHAMLVLLTDSRRNTMDKKSQYCARSGSVLELFSVNSMPVYAFFGKSSGRMIKSEIITRMLTQCARESHWSDGLPLTVVPKIKKVLHENQKKNIVLYINNEGSHMPFRSYDVDAAAFRPARPSLSNPSQHALEVNNAYDNTICYTDNFIQKTVEQMQGRPYIYVYVSDHGEWLGHDSIWGRGGVKDYHSTTGSRVGMFVITSPEFEALHPHFAEAVKNLRKNADMTVGHEHIYHTLLGIFGISTPYYDARLDLSSENPEPYSGPKPATPPQPDSLPATLLPAA